MSDVYPEFFKKMVRIPAPETVGRAWVISDRVQVLFYEIGEQSSSDDLAEGDEWGIILAGRVDITVAGETTTYRKGDTYLIPGGVPSHKVNYPGLVAIDVFEQADHIKVEGLG